MTRTFFLGASAILISASAGAATLSVTNTSDSGPGSLRQAIQSAAAGSMVVFQIPMSDPGYNPAEGAWTIRLDGGQLAVTASLSIVGPGARALVVRGNNTSRIFSIASGKTVTISGITVRDGKALAVSGLSTNARPGGGIFNAGALTLLDCEIRNNVAGEPGVASAQGGGIHNASGASLTMRNCAVAFNSALGGQAQGGGIYNRGRMSLMSCTIASNQLSVAGGTRSGEGAGIANAAGGGATVTNCTISHNIFSASDPGSSGVAGGFVNASGATVTILNCIIAANKTLTSSPDVSGVFESYGYGHNIVGNTYGSSGWSTDPGDPCHDYLGGTTEASALDARLTEIQNNGGATDTVALQSTSPGRDYGDSSLAPAGDQRGFLRNGGSDSGAFEFGGLGPSVLANISTRLRGEAGENVLIGGFIVTGTQPKKVIVRAMGTSLPFADRMNNPVLELHGPTGLIDSNNDWIDSPRKQAIIDSTIAPASALESAIVQTLPANNTAYTAVVRGVNGGTGMAVVEVYDLNHSIDSKLANISTRGLISTGDNVLIAGTIVVGQTSQRVIVRAIGPSLNLSEKIADPTLELRDGNGGLIRANDNWRTGGQEAEIIQSTVPPTNDFESAIVATLPAGAASYTAIVRGVNDTTGIAVVEVYALQ